MPDDDCTARRRALIDDIHAKSATLMDMSRQAGAQGRQLSDVLAEMEQSEQDTEPAAAADQPPVVPTGEPAPPRRPRPDPGQGARGFTVDTSAQADMRRKTQQLMDMAAHAAGYHPHTRSTT